MSKIVDNNGTRGGEGGGGEYDGECQFDKDCNDNEFNHAEDGKRLRGGADNMGNLTTLVTMSSVGCPLGAWGGGHQLLVLRLNTLVLRYHISIVG